MLYPLKFKNIYKEKVWGGKKLKHILNKPELFSDLTGESWEISGLKNNVSVVAEGFLKNKNLSELISEFKERLLGKKVYNSFGNEFPLLFKFIDAADDLSVQVHPNDEYAEKKHNLTGKTEFWYIIDAEKDAYIVYGFNNKISKKQLLNAVKNNSVKNLLNFTEVFPENYFFIPAGTVHAIGKGILLAEIQQSSDITYRIYDWNRPDSDGKLRELHIEDSAESAILDVSNEPIFAELKKDTKINLTKCKYFTVNLLNINREYIADYSKNDSFTVLMCIKGNCNLLYKNVKYSLLKGQTVLIPAEITELKIIPTENCKLLETYI